MRERGLHERAARSGISFACPITWISIPMKPDPDANTFELVQWPVLLPADFESQLNDSYILFLTNMVFDDLDMLVLFQNTYGSGNNER